ncbi:MAG: NAD-dependent epimerase/dehydratase family protein [Verrucomicrobia bacterium]|nr:NAD-dependent epimerase/dehydratase family protein [Verrucomicrobiota bacterium]MBU6446428.1 NAD-dependent epimerase/dehydratase family protein [Verrucomicrobiota bacterium]MDE3047951.1 NAD-dependent epimerase/dehydratase family protein [Verrucomicrobiota bacterium]
MKRILITGAAGFIGFHLASALKKRGDFCLGLDHFNSYYDPNLKRARAAQLKNEGVEVLPLDICDREAIQSLLLQHGITHLVHLAAQAGVRHSLSHPDDYVASNLQGFVSILEAIRHVPTIKLVYASSSSVYGLNKKSPFSVEDPTDRPANLYGATKKANELIAHAYHHLYGIAVTALRYFTVYGPWGRPDMAYYRFTKQIVEGEPIQVFNRGEMKRDFTYIEDIVKGTMAAIDLGAEYEIFNLGNNRPINLLYLIQLIERALGKKAMMEMLPMQPGEVIETFADIEKSQKLLQFYPTVPLEVGIAHFLDWFKQYHGLSTPLQMQLAGM